MPLPLRPAKIQIKEYMFTVEQWNDPQELEKLIKNSISSINTIVGTGKVNLQNIPQIGRSDDAFLRCATPPLKNDQLIIHPEEMNYIEAIKDSFRAKISEDMYFRALQEEHILSKICTKAIIDMKKTQIVPNQKRKAETPSESLSDQNSSFESGEIKPNTSCINSGTTEACSTKASTNSPEEPSPEKFAKRRMPKKKDCSEPATKSKKEMTKPDQRSNGRILHDSTDKTSYSGNCLKNDLLFKLSMKKGLASKEDFIVIFEKAIEKKFIKKLSKEIPQKQETSLPETIKHHFILFKRYKKHKMSFVHLDLTKNCVEYHIPELTNSQKFKKRVLKQPKKLHFQWGQEDTHAQSKEIVYKVVADHLYEYKNEQIDAILKHIGDKYHPIDQTQFQKDLDTFKLFTEKIE
ncbi:unnamed protein product [Moneuplotes crassus]|uniref:Uncharacterized protein n=1 Tax=Euplotes crassus TaxID=5936 RepID=A0AAD1XGE6_EUPCR|nr:unnamed protein product [Moneuplotes crassus]